MNKNELIKQISVRTGSPQIATLLFMKALMEIIMEEVKQENIVNLQGFGRFSLWKQSGRMARNPKTGEAVKIHPCNSVKFKPGKIFKEDLNK